MNRFFPLFLSLVSVSLPQKVMAHCPLCTAGAGAAAAGAAVLGVKHSVIGLFIGAFAAALGFYMASRIKKQFLPGQKWIIVTASFLLTVLPIMPLIESYTSLNLYWAGEYGSLLNRTYLINIFVFGSILGAVLMASAPLISNAFSKLRGGEKLPYQGMAVTFLVLIAAGLILQLVL